MSRASSVNGPRAGVSGMREALATVGLLLDEGTRESPRYKVAPRA